MIILDTNVVSEAMKPAPHVAVRAWLNDQVAETLYLSSVTLAELLFDRSNKRNGLNHGYIN
jgi:predicted nucleic acid-binding protein